MCGRLALTLPHEAMVALFDAVPSNDLPDVPNYNVCPTVQIPVVTADTSGRRLRPMRWGFIPHWYREGKDTPLPWFVQRADGAPLVMAGIWQDWEHAGEAFTSCAVVTTAANAAMARIHHRIPVILTEDQWPLWLGEAGKGAATLMESPPEDALSFHRVATAVNSNRASGAALITPLEVS